MFLEYSAEVTLGKKTPIIPIDIPMMKSDPVDQNTCGKTVDINLVRRISCLIAFFFFSSIRQEAL